MQHTYHLHRSQLVHRPRDEVFAFFSDAHNLQRITPASLKFAILTPPPIEMRQGTLIDYRLKLSGIPLHWQSRIEEFDPPLRFVDVQSRGPYKLWRHTHEFREVDAGTQVVDHVEYQLPLGPLGRVAHALFVRRSLAGIFDHRAGCIARLLEEHQEQATA